MCNFKYKTQGQTQNDMISFSPLFYVICIMSLGDFRESLLLDRGQIVFRYISSSLNDHGQKDGVA